MAGLPGAASSAQSTAPTTSTTMQVSGGSSFPITNYLAPVLSGGNVGANGTVLKTAGTSAGVMQLPGSFAFMPGTRATEPWGAGLQAQRSAGAPLLRGSASSASLSGRLFALLSGRLESDSNPLAAAPPLESQPPSGVRGNTRPSALSVEGTGGGERGGTD